jgi:Arylsulfotransferase (ASST)
MMRERFTRRRFLSVVGGGATYLALTNVVGCDRSERAPQAKSPKGGTPSTPKVSPLSSASPAHQGDVWAFRSRPDLSPPAVEVTAQAHHTAPGYIFVAPEEGDTRQGGSMIVDDRGEVVWFRPLQGRYGRAHDLKVQSYRGKSVLTWMDGANEYVIFDDSYKEIARFSAGNGYNGDHHEFLISPQDTALITIFNAVPWDLSSIGGLKNDRVWQGIIQELDIESGEVLFEWHSLEHVGLDETYSTVSQDGRPGLLDCFHANSIEVDHDNNLLVSARLTFAVYKIDRNTGEIIWRLGGKKSDFEMGDGARFAFQHDARRLPDGTISIFDNGTTVFHDTVPEVVEESRGIVLELDEEQMSASLVREYTHPDKQYAHAAGNVQLLPNGNVFIGWGRALVYSEFGKDGELLFDAAIPPPNRSYRYLRFPWSGHPTDRPAAVAERASEEEVEVYASWNGATEVSSWEVLAGPRPGQIEPLGSLPRNGFETALSVRTPHPYVAVQAKDRSGRVLGTTEPMKL